MKNKNLYLVLSILFGVLSVACLVVLIIIANKMLAGGVTNVRIWATVGLGVGFLVSCAFLGAMYTIYSHLKNPNILKNEVINEMKIEEDGVDEEIKIEENDEQDVKQID